MDKKQAWIILTSCMLISLLGSAGIALPYPVLAPYFLDTPANSLNHFMEFNPKILLGIALSLYPLGLLIGSSFIGALSDHYGRRPVLLITLLLSTLGYLLTAYSVIAESYPLFLFSRLLTGICEGNISIARAMAVELHPVINRAKALSLVYATVYGGWLLGPLAGGYLMLLGTEHVFNAAAIAIAVCAVIVMFTIKDNGSQKNSDHSLLAAINKENSFRLLKHKEIRPIFIFYFIYTLGNNAFYEFYPVWFVEIHQFTSDEIAWITVLMTAAMILSSVSITSKIVKTFGNFRTLTVSVILMGLSLVIQPFLPLIPVYILFALIGFFIALNNTVTPNYMSEKFGDYGQGKVMGLQTSIFCLTNVIIALLGSVIAVFSITATMVMSGVLVLLAILWFLYHVRRKTR